MNTHRWLGLKALVHDAVEHGSTVVQRVHMESARRPFDILEQIPPIAAPVRIVRVVHDATTSGVYATIRASNRVVRKTTDLLLQSKPKGGR